MGKPHDANDFYDIEYLTPPIESALLLFKSMDFETIEIQEKETYELTPKIKGEVYFIDKGEVLIYQDNPYVIIGDLWNFLPIGVIEYTSPKVKVKYKLRNATKIYKIKKEIWNEKVHNLNLEPAVIEILSFYLHVLLTRISESYATSNYDSLRTLIIRKAIMTSNNYSSGNETLFQYLHPRTRLSKSFIKNVVNELKKGGYITLDNGVLISINKKIPKKF